MGDFLHLCLQGEDQKKLDILANEVFLNMLAKSGQCAIVVSMFVQHLFVNAATCHVTTMQLTFKSGPNPSMLLASYLLKSSLMSCQLVHQYHLTKALAATLRAVKHSHSCCESTKHATTGHPYSPTTPLTHIPLPIMLVFGSM